jgi:ABC-type multidrug transport system fused ATPase/permease subunit
MTACFLLLDRCCGATQEGEILLDGIPIKDINVASLRRLMGVVSQEPRLFSMTVRESITLGASPWVMRCRVLAVELYRSRMPQARPIP